MSKGQRHRPIIEQEKAVVLMMLFAVTLIAVGQIYSHLSKEELAYSQKVKATEASGVEILTLDPATIADSTVVDYDAEEINHFGKIAAACDIVLNCDEAAMNYRQRPTEKAHKEMQLACNRVEAFLSENIAHIAEPDILLLTQNQE